jgi:hypothetical protein
LDNDCRSLNTVKLKFLSEHHPALMREQDFLAKYDAECSNFRSMGLHQRGRCPPAWVSHLNRTCNLLGSNLPESFAGVPRSFKIENRTCTLKPGF